MHRAPAGTGSGALRFALAGSTRPAKLIVAHRDRPGALSAAGDHRPCSAMSVADNVAALLGTKQDPAEDLNGAARRDSSRDHSRPESGSITQSSAAHHQKAWQVSFGTGSVWLWGVLSFSGGTGRDH